MSNEEVAKFKPVAGENLSAFIGGQSEFASRTLSTPGVVGRR
jgi:hypothetical protein